MNCWKQLLTIFLGFLLAAGSASLQAQQTAESVMVVEAYSGKVLLASNSTAKRPVASLTKMATAAVLVDWAAATGTDLAKQSLRVPQTSALLEGPNPLGLRPGDTLTLRDALNAALLGSDNHAALAIADHVGRSLLQRRGRGGDPVGAFVGEMNRLARSLGMSNTRFGNPHGLDHRGNAGHSTAADMARLSIYVMRKPAITFITRQPNRPVRVQRPDGAQTFTVKNTHELAGQVGILGIKTGTTQASGPCLSTCMDREPLVRTRPDGSKGATPRRLIVVVLNSPDRFGRTRMLLQRGWSSYDAWLAAGAPVKDRRREMIVVPEQPQ